MPQSRWIMAEHCSDERWNVASSLTNLHISFRLCKRGRPVQISLSLAVLLPEFQGSCSTVTPQHGRCASGSEPRGDLHLPRDVHAYMYPMQSRSGNMGVNPPGRPVWM